MEIPKLHTSEWVQFNLDRYIKRFGYKPNLDNPVTFTEKILWRKCYEESILLSMFADKLRVKSIIDGLTPILAVPTLNGSDAYTEITYGGQVLHKPNNFSGKNKVLRTSAEVDKTYHIDISKFKNYGLAKGEWWYSKIPIQFYFEPVLPIVEEIKFFCFQGEPEIALYIDGPNRAWSYVNGDMINITDDKYPPSSRTRATNIPPEIIQALRTLSKPFSHVRIDLMFTESDAYLSEFTFAHRSGHFEFSNPSLNNLLGSMWVTP